MNNKIITSLLLLASILLPATLLAQFFEKQKVVVWEIFDRNNDVKVASSTKQQIRASIVDAFVGSRNYEAYEGNMNDVKSRVRAKGLSESPTNIAKVARELYKVDYVLFTTIKLLQHSNSYDDYQVHLSSELFSTETQKSERIAYVDMKSDVNAISGACTQLLSSLLQEQITTQSIQRTIQYSTSQASSYSGSSQNYVEDANCGLNMRMIYVEGGTFTMGATAEQSDEAYDDEYPTHEVALSSYYIAECEVTQEQWEKIMGTTVYDQWAKTQDASYYGIEWMCNRRGVGNNYPMFAVNWYDACEFCQKLSSLTGRTYILPTEAQWEYAARGGNKSQNYKYSGSYIIDAVAWYYNNAPNYDPYYHSTQPVKSKRANELGIYDMSGNVWEWCMDFYAPYSSSKQYNPTCNRGNRIVLRGGNAQNDAGKCRVSCRDTGNPYSRYTTRGFRVVCIP